MMTLENLLGDQMLNNVFIDEVSKRLRDLSYQDKCSIFDRKCNGCGFASIKVQDENNEVLFFTNVIEKAVVIASKLGASIKRACSYPDGEKDVHSLTEIIMNGCKIWNDEILIRELQEETEFSEITLQEIEEIKQEIHEWYRKISNRRSIRESLHR